MIFESVDTLMDSDDDHHFELLPRDRNKCTLIADVIIIQCVCVCVGAATILSCVWTPEYSTWDFDKLTRIMYLYDSEACGYQLRKAKMISNLQISNDTFGLEVLPIRWQPAITTVSTRLSAKTRKYIELSLTFHVIWFFLAIAFRFIMKNNSDIRALKFALDVFFYSCVIIVGFDFSMAIVYVTHIKQSLTKGMILRYSGWNIDLKLNNYDHFAGWLPILASVCWLRGIVFFMINLYFCKVIRIILRKIRRKEFRKKWPVDQYNPFPEPQQLQFVDNSILVYRLGERKPQI
ncbi:uncharacterized protein LOC111357768 [Spodoptera litura]|uniref:Uncharacterized protein LOC111357768 n=1 Tax=Spodoptera litura TaxID=69820 RepID=A0A9J7EGX5_SPOLT|nr:uncharacterized protein LOC111357768 [Spodoptera litura]